MARAPLTRNAADARQVHYARRKEEEAAKRFDDALNTALQQPAVRLVLWEVLTRSGIYQTFEDTNAGIYYKTARRNFGLEILADIIRVNERLYLAMETEARARERSTNRETEAVHTPPASDEGVEP
jgi:hypothetical protein